MMMLAFDTCFGACSVALSWRTSDGTMSSAARFERLDKGHAERLMPMIGAVMAGAPFGFETIDTIVVTDGPGTFTGTRIGIAAARALSLATAARVLTLSSLELMAMTAAALLGPTRDQRDLAVAVDARRDEVYFQLFGEDIAPLSEPMLLTPAAAVARLRARPTVAVASGAPLLAANVGSAGHSLAVAHGDLQPDARFALDPVFVAALKARPTSASARPRYLRPPDAKPQDGKSVARSP